MSDVLTSPELWRGLVAGLVVVVAALASHRAGQRFPRLATAAVVGPGLLAAAAALFAAEAPTRVWLAVGLLAAAGLAAPAGNGTPVSAALAVPGAFVLGLILSEVPDAPTWRAIVVPAAVVVAAALVRHTDAVVPATGLAALTLGGLVLGVPDTEVPLAVFGAYAPLAGLAGALLLAGGHAPRSLAGLAGGGSVAFAGVFGWAAATGGIGRPASIVGSLACLGLLVAIPIVAALGRRSRPSFVVLAAQLVVVVVAARTAALQRATLAAAVLALTVLILTTIGWWLLVPQLQPKSRPTRA